MGDLKVLLMAKQRRARSNLREARVKREARDADRFGRMYQRACGAVEKCQHREAKRLFEDMLILAPDARRKALVRNDLAALAAWAGEIDAAREGFQTALALDTACELARANLAMLAETVEPESDVSDAPATPTPRVDDAQEVATRVAIVSFLFNWPSTGGGNVHTVELGQFLSRAGYLVQHFYPRYSGWEIGEVTRPVPFASAALEFDEAGWNLDNIGARIREALDDFGPDHVIITDSWSIKPLLTEAVRGYPYILRFQAMECLCPLNGVRLIWNGPGHFRQCQRHQLASPEFCRRCLEENGHMSGSLHQAERALAGVGSKEYYGRLIRALEEAEAVLVVNPLHEAMVSPYTNRVRVVTAGMDAERFPWKDKTGRGGQEEARRGGGKLGVLFAGLVQEPMKGFEVLHEACARLWQRRQDFELVATADPAGRVDEFTRFAGWQSQEDLPRQIREAAILVMPTIAQEALGRTAVEAMAAGRPVVASRLGGLPFTVIDGATGLLCEPGDVDDLGRKIEMLLDDEGLRERMGQAGRRRFEEHYAWPVIIERHYKPLLGEPRKLTTKGTKSTKKSTKEG
jgi:glycosyltransferase involved in cell wall biosynthesis